MKYQNLAGWGKIIIGLAASISAVAHGGQPGTGIPCRYEVTTIVEGLTCDLGIVGGAKATAINEAGDIAGERHCNIGPERPFFKPADGPLQMLPHSPPATMNAPVVGMNSHRQVVGSASVTSMGGNDRPYLIDQGQFTVFGALPPDGNWAEAYAINDAGTIVGFWGNTLGVSPIPCLWSDGKLIDISQTVGATPRGEARDINQQGAITGWRGTSWLIDARAFILHEDHVQVLPPIPGGTTSEGNAINTHGDVVGRGRFATDPPTWRAYLCCDGQAHDLGALPGFTKSIAHDINDHRVVVGESTAQAVIWYEGQMRAIKELIPDHPELDLKIAYSINNAGQIALGGHNGSSVGVLLTPVYVGAGDLHPDCVVNGIDLGALLGAWTIPSQSRCKGDVQCAADLNGDGVVNGIDLGILLANWTTAP